MGRVAQLLAVQHHAACIGGNQADYHVKAGGLTRAVGAEQADDFAAFDFKGEAFDDLAFFETFLQVLNHKTAVVCAHILLTFDIDLRPSEPFSDGLFCVFSYLFFCVLDGWMTTLTRPDLAADFTPDLALPLMV